MYIRRFTVIDAWGAEKLELDAGTSFLTYLNFDWQGIILSSLSSLSGRAINVISMASLIYIFVLFLLMERQSLIPKLKIAAPGGKGMRVAVLFERVNRQVSKYLLLKALISLATGVLFYLACLATGLDFAIMWGVLAFILNFIPSIGSIIITVMTIVMALLQFFPNWANIVYVAVLMISIQTVLGNILDPRIQGVQLNLSPFVILVSLSLWGFIWGVAGMFLAVPITSVLQIVCANVQSLKRSRS
jgi:predicted PurR-regulated permease PerM